MKTIFMGSALFAVPSLEMLCSSHEVVMVASQPDKPAGRGNKLTSPPVAAKAKELGLPLYQPKSVKNEKVIEKLRELKADAICVVAYGKILPREIFEMTKLGCINVHSSLLPKYRGAAPINWAIVNGEKTTGVTTMFINEELDAGDILLKEKVDIGDMDTSITLHDKLAPLGAQLLKKTLEELSAGKIRPKKQNNGEATFAPIIKKEDGLIDWKKDAVSINNLIRGMQPWPSAYTHLDGKMLKIFRADVLGAGSDDTPGTVNISDEAIIITTGNGKLRIHELQIEGKRKMTAQDFMNGHKLVSGTRLE